MSNRRRECPSGREGFGDSSGGRGLWLSKLKGCLDIGPTHWDHNEVGQIEDLVMRWYADVSFLGAGFYRSCHPLH